jgi:hypothetical protein
LLVSTPGSSSVAPFSSGFYLDQVGTIAPFARYTRNPLLLHDQPTYDQHIYSLVDHQFHLFLNADHH